MHNGPTTVRLHSGVSKKPQTIILLSGGLDSTVALAHARKNSRVKLALCFDYGQRAASRELKAAEKIASGYRIPHKIIRLPWLKRLGGSALTDRGETIPHDTDLTGEGAERSAAAVWVPGRNTLFISIALAHAEALKCERIVAGFNHEEGRTFPDNSAEYTTTVNEMLAEATHGAVALECPLAAMDKAEIVALGRRLRAPVEEVWPCYEGRRSMCMKCESCRRFVRALKDSGNWEWYLARRKNMK